MLIGQLSRRTGVSARALRHYEDRGLLVPDRTASGYRSYSEDAVVLVHQIQAMFAAGLNADVVRRYLDCARGDVDGITLEMCPQLRADVDRIGERLRAEAATASRKQTHLAQLVARQVWR